MVSTLNGRGHRHRDDAWLATHPLVGSAVIAVLAGTALQLTHMIAFQDRVAAMVGWNLSVRFIDFGFRTALGACVVLAVLPWLFGYTRTSPWVGTYLRRLRFTLGYSPRRTLAATAASLAILAALIVGLAALAGGLRVDLGFVLEDSRWFVVVLALVPALWEELAFRGLMLTTLQDRYRPWTAILLTSLFFGLFHVSNLLLRGPDQVVMEMVMAAAVSLGWGYAVVKTGSVVPAIVSHYCMNVFIGLLLAPELSETANGVIFASLTVAYPVLTVVAVRWLSQPQSGPAAREAEVRYG